MHELPRKARNERETPTEVRFECIECGECCRHEQILVTVNGRDIARLAYALGLSASQMMRALDFYVVPEDEAIPMGLQDTPSVLTEKGPAYPALKVLEDDSCVFLKDNLCMVHPVRPSVCRSFPFVFERVDGDMKWGLHALVEICPGMGRGDLVTEKELGAIGAAFLEEWSLYREFVDEWNIERNTHSAVGFIRAILEDPRFST